MTEFTIYSVLLNLLYFAITLVVGWLILRMLDKALGITFKKDVLDELLKGNIAVAIYFSTRFLGLCLVASAFLR